MGRKKKKERVSMPGNQDDETIKVGYMIKKSQGKSAIGATNFKKRVFVLTRTRLSYYDGTPEVSDFLVFRATCFHSTHYALCWITLRVLQRYARSYDANKYTHACVYVVQGAPPPALAN